MEDEEKAEYLEDKISTEYSEEELEKNQFREKEKFWLGLSDQNCHTLSENMPKFSDFWQKLKLSYRSQF